MNMQGEQVVAQVQTLEYPSSLALLYFWFLSLPLLHLLASFLIPFSSASGDHGSYGSQVSTP